MLTTNKSIRFLFILCLVGFIINAVNYFLCTNRYKESITPASQRLGKDIRSGEVDLNERPPSDLQANRKQSKLSRHLGNRDKVTGTALIERIKAGLTKSLPQETTSTTSQRSSTDVDTTTDNNPTPTELLPTIRRRH